MEDLKQRFIFRTIDSNDPQEAEYAAYMESVCLPPSDACTREEILDRAKAAPELFFVAVDRKTGQLAGILNGVATNENVFTDDFFSQASALHDSNGSTVMMTGLDVMPQYRRQGLAKTMISLYCQREKAKGRKRLILTCVGDKIEMYSSFGFKYMGVSASVYGGTVWHDMDMILNED